MRGNKVPKAACWLLLARSKNSITIIITLITATACGTRGSNTYCINIVILSLFWFLKQLWGAVYLSVGAKTLETSEERKTMPEDGTVTGQVIPEAVCVRQRKETLFQTVFILG